MWNVAEDGALVEIYKSSNLASSDHLELGHTKQIS